MLDMEEFKQWKEQKEIKRREEQQRQERERQHEKNITLAGGAVRKGRPPTTGHYVGRRRTAAQRATARNVPAVPIDTAEPREASGPAAAPARQAPRAAVPAPIAPQRATATAASIQKTSSTGKRSANKETVDEAPPVHRKPPRKKPMVQDCVTAEDDDTSSSSYVSAEGSISVGTVTKAATSSVGVPVSARPPIPVGAAVSVAQPAAAPQLERVPANVMTIASDVATSKTSFRCCPYGVKTLEIYSVLVDKKHVHYQFTLDYEEFRKRWKGKDVWYRFPGKGKQQILLDDEKRYHQFLTRVKENNEAPTMWEHSDADFHDDDDDASFYSKPPPPPPPPPPPQPSVLASTVPLIPTTRRVSFDSSVTKEKEVGNNNAIRTRAARTGSQRTNASDVTTTEAVLSDKEVGVEPEPPKKRGPGRPKGSLNKKKSETEKPKRTYVRKVAGTVKEKTPAKEKAKKSTMRTRSQDAIQKEIMSGVMNQNQSDEVRSSTTTGECDDTYLPVRPWEDMSSSQVPPPSCGQPLLRVATQQNAPEPMPLCAQPRSSVFTQNSTQSSFMPTQPNNSESFTSTAPPRLLPRMFTQTQTI
ncbi:uncharacterized protein LAJ45_03778 [Morchella importuna]|uniref:uncharacterized protein n=1 Tax=Morchella importuna TaxID=1174673 RepID=UPI001E8E5C8F|nr:uncharacterized protein LAJ45_03778 [Morchella importuna]KAH8152351.1 hypothetical protein LAJ45_03778 [Morchella importuna]